MKAEALTAEERHLVDQTAKHLRSRCRNRLNTVCAGLLTTSGTSFFGLSLASRKSDVCAEPAAIAASHLANEHAISSIVAVCHTPSLDEVVVISPCGACRELICYHAPDARVLLTLDGDDEPSAVAARDLFVAAELFPVRPLAHVTDWAGSYRDGYGACTKPDEHGRTRTRSAAGFADHWNADESPCPPCFASMCSQKIQHISAYEELERERLQRAATAHSM